MTMRIAGLALTALLIALSWNAWSASKYQYIIDATNRMIQLNSQSMSPSPEDLARAAAETCKALQQLLEDREFRKDLDNITEADAKTRQERMEMKRDLTLFVSAFLRAEEAVLAKAGLKERAAKEILWSASMLRQALDDKHDSNRIIGAIDKFRAEVCQGATVIQQAQDAPKRTAKLRRWAFRIGGIALIIADLAGAMPTASVAVGSVAIGTAVASWSE